MKRILVACVAILVAATQVAAAPITGPKLGQLGLGTLGGLAGAVLAVTAISEIAPQIESRAGSTAVVIGSITLFDGLAMSRRHSWVDLLADLRAPLSNPSCIGLESPKGGPSSSE